MRIEPNAVLKYFEPIDGFVKIRRFTDAEAETLLKDVRVSTRRGYIALVLNACVVNYTELLLPQFAKGGVAEQAALEDRLYLLCVEVSPALDLRRISIPVTDEGKTEIHLLERREAPAARDLNHLKDMEERLSQRVIGQEHAIASVSRAVKKAMTGLRDPARPMATFFFVGQTGVGKTELAKALTVCLWSDPDKMVRVDCSEYALPHEVAKLVGSPPGYIGHEQSGLLSEAIAARGQALVLFDEIEKSDAKVHDLLLQMMDEGFITDNKGRRVPFGDTLIILTSNVGADEIEELRNRMGFDAGKRNLSRHEIFDEMIACLKTRFKPEFVNRISEVVLFNPIGLKECVRIAELMLEDVKRHAATIPLTLHVAGSVPHFLAEKGYKPAYGARELRRTVEREVEGRLSDLIIDGRIRRGDTVAIHVSHDHLVFHRN
ncbi:MAG: ATP-dependent Clp protease ATP-binding subunit [Planctomycetes bacterium]|nr:ATP-dependent Clp protease ATP-binding subunit [Planctomycetota bacterium]